MFTIFNQPTTVSYGVTHSTQWPYVKNRLQSNVKIVQDYEREYLRAVPNNHFLVNLIMGMEVPLDIDLNRYYDSVDSLNLKYCQSMGLTSSLSRGSYKKGIFYSDSTEILLAIDDSFDYRDADKNWKDLVPVKPLLHCKSDIGLVPPKGIRYSNEVGLCVIQINLTMLMVMYRAFVNSQEDNSTGTNETAMQFVAGYVLPNMLPAQLDLCVFNKAYNDAFGIDSSSVVHYKHPFNLPDVQTQFDYSIKQSLDNIAASPKNFDLILQSIACVFSDSLSDALEMPDVAATQQVDWCLIAARIKAMDLLVKLAGDYALATNSTELRHAIYAYRKNSVSQMLDMMLPPVALAEIDAQRHRVIEAAKMLDLEITTKR